MKLRDRVFPDDVARWEIDDLRKQFEKDRASASIGVRSATITPHTPFEIAKRVNRQEQVFVTLGWDIPDTLRGGKFVARRDKGDGTYGPKHKYSLADITEEERTAGYCEREAGPFDANQTWHVVRTKGTLFNPLISAETKVYEPFYEDDISTAPAGTPLATFTTGPGGIGPETKNYIRNGLFEYSIDAWRPGTGGSTTALAHWDYDRNIGVLPVDTTVGYGNYWDKTKSWIVLTNATATYDVCSELRRRPFKAGHPINVGFMARLASSYTGAHVNMIVTLEDSVAGVISTMVYDRDGTGTYKFTNDLTTTFQEFRFTGVVSSSYAPSGTAKQYIRFHLDGTPGVAIYFDLPHAHQKAGAYSPHTADESDERGDPDGTGRDNTNGRGGTSWQTGPSDPPTGYGQVLLGVTD